MAAQTLVVLALSCYHSPLGVRGSPRAQLSETPRSASVLAHVQRHPVLTPCCGPRSAQPAFTSLRGGQVNLVAAPPPGALLALTIALEVAAAYRRRGLQEERCASLALWCEGALVDAGDGLVGLHAVGDGGDRLADLAQAPAHQREARLGRRVVCQHVDAGPAAALRDLGEERHIRLEGLAHKVLQQLRSKESGRQVLQ